MSTEDGLPSVCPVCGAYSLAPDSQQSALLAVCDVLVLKALEKMGNYIVRADRARFRIIGSKPIHLAHTIWAPTDDIVSRATRGAWDVVPALLDMHGCCDVTSIQVTGMLNAYVHDLAITGTPHTLRELMYRFETQLGLPVFYRTLTATAGAWPPIYRPEPEAFETVTEAVRQG